MTSPPIAVNRVNKSPAENFVACAHKLRQGKSLFANTFHLSASHCKNSNFTNSYSSPRLVVDWMEELIVGLLLVENAWCQKQSWSFMHLLCSGMVGFGLRQKFGTAGAEHNSPLLLPAWKGYCFFQLDLSCFQQ